MPGCPTYSGPRHEAVPEANINLLILLPPIPDNYKCLSIPIDYLYDSSIPPNPTLAKECHERRKQLIHRTVALGFRGRAHRRVVRFNCYGEIFKQAVCVEGGISVWWAGRAHRRRRAGERQATGGKHRLCMIEGTMGARGARSFLGGKPAGWGNGKRRTRRRGRVLCETSESPDRAKGATCTGGQHWAPPDHSGGRYWG
ncbi:hypothetical protein BGY98DRAFT_1159609 [Russula aff. rugulosa BPL654]|nr:hypothetical protein BGY98DRAFT_1159609 [Russula aff. rugulosa BPL654]